jgi:1-acyl-sn-glycerol-3-phosphate acyltransferase
MTREPQLLGSAERGGSVPELDPWFNLAHAALRPPMAAWFNWRFENIEGIPREGPLLVAGNHVSYLDPVADAYMLIKAGRHARFLAKSELFDVPVIGTVLRGAGQIPVFRGSGSDAPLQAAVDALHAGEAVVVYPEATITKDPESLPMKGKMGIARLALDAGLPVLPLAIWGSQYVWQRSGIQDLRFGRPIWMKAGEPVDLSEFGPAKDEPTTLRRATERVMGELRTLVLDLRARYPRRWS